MKGGGEMSLEMRPRLFLSVLVFALLLVQLVPSGEISANGENVPTDGQGNEYFPVVGSFSNASIFSTTMSTSKEVMVKDNTHMYVIYTGEHPVYGKTVYLTRSTLGNYSWEEPMRIWDQGDYDRIRPGICISNGMIYALLDVKVEKDWETWSFYCKEIPVDDWRNITRHRLTRLDDTQQGYTSVYAAIDFKGELYIFWTRSHFMKCVYRVRDQNGTWSPIRSVDPSNYYSKISVLTRNIGGRDHLYLYYQYYPENRVYLTTTTDGSTWSQRKEIMYLEDEPDRFEVEYFNGKYHMAIGELQDFDVYYSSSINGMDWSPLSWIGIKKETINTAGFPDIMNVDLTISLDTGEVFITYDHEKGIAIHRSKNNGSTFSGPFLFDGDGFQQPAFDSWGQHILLMNGADLQVRSLVHSSIPEEPLSDETDPDDDPFPEVGSFSKVNFTTTFTSTWEEMAKDGTHQYVIYTGEDIQKRKSVYITRSTLGNYSWEDPLRIWELGDFYGFNPGIYISNGTIYAFFIQKITDDWTTWSYYCKEIPIDQWRDSSKHVVTRLDDTISGYIQSSNYIELNGELFVFWTRSHFVEGVYKIRHSDGTWSNIKYIDPSVNIAVGSVIKRTINGEDRLHYYYQYYHESRLYLYTTSDGENWSNRKEVLYLPDAPDVFEIIYHNNKYHMVVGERYGTDVYYLTSINGIDWSDPKWIGQKPDISSRTEFPFRLNVALTVSEETGYMYVTYDHKDGAAVHVSTDNGSTFSLLDVFDGKWFQFPTFDHWGKHLIYMDGDHLRIRSLHQRITPDDPSGNDTDPEDPPSNDTTPGNDTDPEDPPSDPLSIEEEDVEVELETLKDDEGEKLYLVAYSSVVDLDDDEITVEWYVEGIGIIGYGRELIYEGVEGISEVIMRIRDKGTLVFENTYIVDNNPDTSTDDDEDLTLGFLMVALLSAMVVMISILLALVLVFIPLSRRKDKVEEGYMAPPHPYDGIPGSIGEPKDIRKGALYSPHTLEGPVKQEPLQPRSQMALKPAGHGMKSDGENLDIYRERASSKDIHMDQSTRKELLLKKARKKLEKGDLGPTEYKKVLESLNYD